MANAGSKQSSALAGLGKHRFSVASGVLACLASVLGKVAFDGESPLHLLARSSCHHHFAGWGGCNMVGLGVQGVSLAGMFLVNAVMLSMYLKALEISGSTVATVTNCATNFLLSGVLGRMLFGEHLSFLWFCGASLVVSGVMLVVVGTSDKTSRKDGLVAGDIKRSKEEKLTTALKQD
ncbi:unnamed protein product [Ascophyllum nodosum]